MSKSLRKKLEEEGKWEEIHSSITTPKTNTSNSVTSNTSIKTQVDNLFNENNSQNNNFWDRVKERASNILNDTQKIGSNFGLGVKSSLKNAGYYIQANSENNFSEYKKYNKTQSMLKEETEAKEKGQAYVKGLILNENGNLTPAKKYDSVVLKNIEKSISKDEEKIQKNIENTETKIGQKVAELTPSMAQSTVGIGLSTINPALGMAFFQTSAGGSYTREAKEKGLNDKQAMVYGTIMGAMESATEMVGGELTKNVGKAILKNGAKEGFKAFGLDVAENFFEEAIMEPIQEIVMSATGGEADWDNMGERMLESGINGALTSVIMGGISAGIGKATQLVTKIEKGEQINQQELVDTLKAINNSEEVDIEKILAESFKFTAEDLMKNTTVQENTNSKLEKIANEISTAERQNIINSNDDLIYSNKNLTNIQKQKLTEIKDKYNLDVDKINFLIENTLNGKYDFEAKNVEQNQVKNQVLNTKQQINQADNNLPKNQSSEQIDIYNKKEVIQEEKYNIIREKIYKNTYKNSENAQEFLKSAINNNIDVNSKEIEKISKILDNRNLKGSFNSEVFNGDTNKGALYVNGEIVLNPNTDSKKGLYDILLHETTHSILDNAPDLRNAVLETLKSDSRYEQMYNDVANRYSEEYKNFENFTSDIEEEMIADYLGENLSTEEFMTRLEEAQKTKNQSKIKQVIDNFIQKIKDFFTSRFGTGIKETDAESYYWNKIQDLFYDAYLNTENVGTSKYSIQTDSNGNKYVKVDTDQDIFEGVAKKDYNKIAKMYIQDYLMGETTLAGTDTAKIDNRSANKYTNPKQNNKHIAEKMQLTPELKNVLEIAKKEGSSLPVKENSKYRNWEYYRFAFELSGKMFEGTVNIGIDKNGNKHFYEINKIHTTSNSSVSTNTFSSTDSINTSIPQSKENSNTNIKYSMQENKNNTIKKVEDIENKYKKQVDYIILNEDDKLINIRNLVVKEELRNKGIGQNILDDIIEYANRTNKTITLTPTNAFNTKNKLKKWYNKNGFVENKGKNTDFTISDTMYKLPSLSKNSSKSSFSLPQNHKQQQLEIIQKSNPMLDDYHTGIRSIEDIKTLEETLQDSDWADYEEFNPDLTRKMIEESIKNGKITVYSSNPIEQGTFVSPSRMEAESYSENGKIYEKTVKIEDIAWIDPTQGQFAKINNQNNISVENNSNLQYNNVDRSGIYEERYKSDIGRRLQNILENYKRGQGIEGKGNGSIQKISSQKDIKRAVIDFANAYQKKSLNNKEKNILNIYKKLNGDVIFYEYGKNNIDIGLSDKDIVYIDTATSENIDNIAYHELAHFLRQNKNEAYINNIQPIVDKIANNFDLQEIIYNYAKSNENFEIGMLDGNYQDILAEEVIGDTIASLYGNLEANYGLTQEDIQIIKNTIDSLISENSNKSSFSLPQKSVTDNQGNNVNIGIQNWAKNSYARENNDLNGKLKLLYHGTNTGEFYAFDENRANPEGDWGAGIYLTDSQYDVKTNYEGGGADFENKVSRLAEEIEQNEDISYEEAKQKARLRLDNGAYLINAYANITNPAIVGETKLFEIYNEDLDINEEDYENYEEYEEDLMYAIDDKIAEEVEDALSEIRRVYDISYEEDKIKNIIYEAIYNNEGVEIQELKDKLNEEYIEVYDDNGNLVTNDIVRLIIKSQGYDGIIDNTVSGKWNNMQMEKNTTHYIVFNSNQVKDINNTNPTSNPDIRYSQNTTGEWNKYLTETSRNNENRKTIEQLKENFTSKYNAQNILPISAKNKSSIQEINYQDIINNAQYIPNEEKASLLKEVENIEKSENSLKDFQLLVDEMDNTYKELDEEILKAKTYNTGNKEIYTKYMNATNEYDKTAINNALDIIPANSQGKRTKEQWLDIAKQIGAEVSEKNNTEIEEIAFRSWQDLRPNSKDSLNRQGSNYVSFNSDEWVNTIYSQVKEIRNNKKFPVSENNINKNLNKPSVLEDSIEDDLEAFSEATEELYLPNKPRSYPKTVLASDYVSAEVKAKAKKILKDERYVPIPNSKTIDRATKIINKLGVDNRYKDFNNKFDSNDNMTLDDISTAELLIQHYSNVGDLKKTKKLITEVAIVGTELGQKVQALSIIKKSTPIGQLQVVNKIAERLSDKHNIDIEISEETQNKILNSSMDNVSEAVSEAIQEIADQMPLTWQERLDNFRYLSMLGNPTTHIRNMVGNISMGRLQGLKNIVSGSIQDIYSFINKDFQKTATLKPANQDQRDYAKIDAERMADSIDNVNNTGNRYSTETETELQKRKKDFNTPWLNSLSKGNYFLLDAEDKKFLKWAYKDALANYMSANNLTSEFMEDSDNLKEANKAREWAINQAKEATFHQYSVLASELNRISNKWGNSGTLPRKSRKVFIGFCSSF